MAGEAVWLLLHRTPLTPRVWEGIRPFLEKVRPVVAPLLPRAAHVTGAQAEIAQHVLASLDDRQARLHVVGHSFGGQVAIEVALAAPRRVASLTIICGRARPFPAFAESAASLRSGEALDVEGSLAHWFLPGELAAGGPVVPYGTRATA